MLNKQARTIVPNTLQPYILEKESEEVATQNCLHRIANAKGAFAIPCEKKLLLEELHTFVSFFVLIIFYWLLHRICYAIGKKHARLYAYNIFSACINHYNRMEIITTWNCIIDYL